MRRLALPAILLLALPLRGQEPQPPVFTVGVDIVAVDVNVVDDRGNPYRGLSHDDFKVTVDGKPRRLVTVEYVDLSPEARAAVPREEQGDYTTNEGVTTGRLVLIVVDKNNIRAGGGRPVLDTAGRLLSSLSSSDRVAAVGLPGPSTNVDFTTDHPRVQKALIGMVGQARFGSDSLGLGEAQAVLDRDPFRFDEIVRRECAGLVDFRLQACINALEADARAIVVDYRAQSEASRHALQALLEGLKTLEGPKTLVLVSGGMGTEDLRWSSTGDIRQLADAAAAARVTLYVLQIEGNSVDASQRHLIVTEAEDQQRHRAGLDTLAGMTKGTVFRVTGGGEFAFDRIARELSGYYLLGFEPEEHDRDGRTHDIRIAVARRGVSIRTRDRVNIPRSDAGGQDEASLGSTLRSPFLATELPVRATSYALPDRASRKVRVLVSAEVARAQGALTVAFVMQDAKGKLVASGLQRLAEASQDPVIFAGTAVVEPGTYSLRLAARDRSGRRGSVVHPVKAALVSAGGLELGDLVLGPPPTTQSFRPPVRVRADNGRLTAHLELLGKDAARAQKATLTLEVAEAEGKPALLSVPMRTTGEGESRIGQVTLALGVLPPGDYVARAAVSVDGKPVAGLTKAFHLAPPPGAAAAGEGVARAGLVPAVPKFDLRETLAPDVVGHFLDRLLALTPGPVSPDVRVSIDEARAGGLAKLVEHLDKSQRPDVRVAFLRGLGFLSRPQLDPASTQFRAALRLESGLFPAAFYLGATYAAGGDDRQAVGAWQTALITETDSPVLYRLLGDALLRLEEGEQAMDILKEGVAAWPEDAALKRRLGVACAMAGHDNEAVAALAPYVEAHPADNGALYVMLRVLLEGLATSGAGEGRLDRERLVHYARAYVDTQGPNREIVAHWLRYLEKEAH